MKTFTFLIVFMVLMATANFAQAPTLEPGVSQKLAQWRAANYSDVRYKLNITLEKGAPTLKGTIEIRVSVRQSDAETKKPDEKSGSFQIVDFLPTIILDWRKIKSKENLSTISNVSVNGRFVVLNPDFSKFNFVVEGREEQNYFEFNEHLIFQDGVKIGENVIRLDFTSPIATSGAAITRYVDREDGAEYIYSLFVPSDASTAFPVFDQPDLKARFQLTVNAPSSWIVVSNTPFADVKKTLLYRKWLANDIIGQVFERNIPFEFAETKPISTYVFAFAAGDFAEFVEYDVNEMFKALAKEGKLNKSKNGVSVTSSDLIGKEGNHIYVRKSQAEKFRQHSKEVFRLNREGVKFLESYFDFKFPFPKYDLVLIPEFPFRGMEHAGATFLREDSIIFPSEPTANDFISRANVIFHEAAHQWFGDTVTMKWFDDLWLKEGFAEFMAYKTLEKVMPEYNAWKAFYERNKPLAYLTDSTKGTTPIYQEIPNLSSAKSAYGNIVYRKAPSFLRQAEFYLGEDKFQTAVRAFLKKHEFANASWQDLVSEFAEVQVTEIKKGDFYQKLSYNDKTELENFTRWSVGKEWAQFWVEKRGAAVYRISPKIFEEKWDLEGIINSAATGAHTFLYDSFSQTTTLKDENYNWLQDVKVLKVYDNGEREMATAKIGYRKYARLPDLESKPREEYKFNFEETEESRKQYEEEKKKREARKTLFVFPNYQDYGYGIFLLDEKSRDYVLKNIQNEKDDFLRSMMWGALWDSVREAELAPKEYVELAIKNIALEKDELTISTILARVSTAMNYYLSEPPAVAGGLNSGDRTAKINPSATADGSDKAALAAKLEELLIEKMQTAPTLGLRITFYRAFLNTASSEKARTALKQILKGEFGNKGGNPTVKEGVKNDEKNSDAKTKTLPNGRVSASNAAIPLKTKDKFDIVTKLLILGDKDALSLLAELEKTETSDEAKRYAYAARAGIGTSENKLKFWNDFVSNKDISESWIEAAFVSFNSPKHSDLTLPYLEKALAELPNLKRNRKIFFVNGWLAAFIGGQRSEEALKIVNKFLADNPNLDKDLRLKILENVDLIERAVKIRTKYSK